MKIMSFNTQHCLGYIEKKIDFDLMAKTICESGADIIGLNEMRGEGEIADYTDQTGKLSMLTGINNYYFAKAIDVGGKNAPYGNALLSKYTIESAETIKCRTPIRVPETKDIMRRAVCLKLSFPAVLLLWLYTLV